MVTLTCLAKLVGFAPFYAETAERFHPRGQQLYKFTGTKKGSYIRKRFSSLRTGLKNQHGHCFIVLEHQYGHRDVMKTLYCWFARDVTAGVHVGGQEQKHFAPLGTKLCCHVNSLKKNSIVLTPNMAALSHGCSPRV